MIIANLSHSREGTSIEISEVPWWVMFAERIGEEVGHHLRLLNAPEWTYLIRWGPYEETFTENGKRKGWTSKSLGSKLWDLGQWCFRGFGAWRHRKRIGSIPVSYEWVREHFPDAGWPWDGSSDDEMRCAPGDKGEIVL